MSIWQASLSRALQFIGFHPQQKRGPRPQKKKKRELIYEKYQLLNDLLDIIIKNPDKASIFASYTRTRLRELGILLNIDKPLDYNEIKRMT